MITIEADALLAILDKTMPHRAGEDDTPAELDVVILDCTRGYLHAVVRGSRTLAVARTPIRGGRWMAPLDYADALALRSWLESCATVRLDYDMTSGLPRLHFMEGAAEFAVPVAAHAAPVPWREVLGQLGRCADGSWGQGSRPVRLSSEDLVLWEHADAELDFHPLGSGLGFLVSAPDFRGFQMVLDVPAEPQQFTKPWISSLRTGSFLYQGKLYEVGAHYVDVLGHRWLMPTKPAPGQEPKAVSADVSTAALPLGVVLAVAGPLAPVSDFLSF
ncbi:hypothetical protein [Streptomyces jumonjinensis]|uniref:Uncharacterized protein n=1 Tax=Streptomyces jumonjinensis TaxID=1945 RepID=A0A646KTN0_STRJU|nr:hypothetical protein [Streptomyces jumonjinensis]MQT05450.1 hypothetical protein [Streptomyces jumonjinensis]